MTRYPHERDFGKGYYVCRHCGERWAVGPLPGGWECPVRLRAAFGRAEAKLEQARAALEQAVREDVTMRSADHAAGAGDGVRLTTRLVRAALEDE